MAEVPASMSNEPLIVKLLNALEPELAVILPVTSPVTAPV